MASVKQEFIDSDKRLRTLASEATVVGTSDAAPPAAQAAPPAAQAASKLFTTEDICEKVNTKITLEATEAWLQTINPAYAKYAEMILAEVEYTTELLVCDVDDLRKYGVKGGAAKAIVEEINRGAAAAVGVDTQQQPVEDAAEAEKTAEDAAEAKKAAAAKRKADAELAKKKSTDNETLKQNFKELAANRDAKRNYELLEPSNKQDARKLEQFDNDFKTKKTKYEQDCNDYKNKYNEPHYVRYNKPYHNEVLCSFVDDHKDVSPKEYTKALHEFSVYYTIKVEQLEKEIDKIKKSPAAAPAAAAAKSSGDL